jgi:lysophospholipase L1-like esterase
MLIYFNGDSNVAGTELPETTHGMAPKLAERFDGQYKTKFINDATPGASNDLIYEQTLDFLNNPSSPKPDLVVIGWTQFNRVQWF